MSKKEIVKKGLLTILFIALLILFLVFLFPKILVFFMPCIIGGLIAWIVSPVVKFFEEKLKIHRKAGTIVIICTSIGLLVVWFYFLANFVFVQGVELVNSLPDMLSNVNAATDSVKVYLSKVFSKLPDSIESAIYSEINETDSYLTGLVSKISTVTLDSVTAVAKSLPMFFLSTIVSILSAYFFVAEGVTLTGIIKKYCPESVKNIISTIFIGTKNAIGGYFIAQLKIEGCVYISLIVGFLLLDVPFAWLVSLGIAFLDFLPIFGTGTAIVPWACIEAINGNYLRAVCLLVIWGISQLLRQLLQPRFVGNQVGLSEISTLFLMYAGFVLGGVIGMIISIPIGIVFVSLNQAGVFETIKSSIKEMCLLLKSSKNTGASES